MDVRVACTPYNGARRVLGAMVFHDPPEPAVPAPVGAIVASASPLLGGVALGRTQRHLGWSSPSHPQKACTDRDVAIGARGRRTRHVGTGNRSAADRIHHRQATRRAARIRPATPNRPIDTGQASDWWVTEHVPPHEALLTRRNR